MPRACIFCGRPANSQEHIWPQWAARALTEQNATSHGRLRLRQGQPLESDGWRQRPFSMTTGVVCRDCNNGWMSALERDVQDILKAMTAGRGRALHQAGQERLACWAFKTALVVDHAQSPADCVVPATVARAFYERRRPPDDHRIWLSGYSGELHGLIDKQGADEDPHGKDPSRGERDVYTVTFGFEAAVFQIVGGSAVDAVEVTKRDEGPRACSLWPYARPFTWMPRHDVSAAAVLAHGEQAFARLRRVLQQGQDAR